MQAMLKGIWVSNFFGVMLIRFLHEFFWETSVSLLKIAYTLFWDDEILLRKLIRLMILKLHNIFKV
ncbi:MAG: hypothetical protein RL557_983 [archaeon]|jgi:hypothetical protein